VEDVIAVKALEHSMVPPIAHFDKDFEPDPDLGDLNLSRGGQYPVEFSLRLGAGFGSQIAMTLLRKVAGVGERVNQGRYQEWLAAVSGYHAPELEVVQHNLRVKHIGATQIKPMQSKWEFGVGPLGWASDQPRLDLQPVNQELTLKKPVEASTGAKPEEIMPVVISNIQDDEVKNTVLGMVSEKTGYPVEMLDLELDLEADLGVDTVKQAELFRSIREQYGIPRREDLRLSDYNTLEKVIQFVIDAKAEKVDEPSIDANEQNIVEEQRVESDVRIRRRIPVAVLRPRLDLCIPTGIELGKSSRVIVVRDQGKVFSALEKKLKSRDVEVLRLDHYDSEKAIGQIKTWQETGNIDGLYFLPSLDE